jgi:hypothetical protein
MKDGIGLSHTDAAADPIPHQLHLALIRTFHASSLLTQRKVGCAVVNSMK